VAARDAGQEGYFSCRAAVRSMRPEGSPSSLGREKMKEACLLAARMLPKGLLSRMDMHTGVFAVCIMAYCLLEAITM
jgi:hypothetical protein